MSVCAVLREQGCHVAARIYRAWKSDPAPAARTVSDAVLIDALRATTGQPESLYGRRKMTAHLRRSGHRVAHCTADRLMREQGVNGVTRARSHRTTTTGRDGTRAGDLLDRDFSAPAPNLVWVADFTHVRTWAGFIYVAFVVDVFSQNIVDWHAMTNKVTDLVLTCLRMATWRRGHDGHRVGAGLVHHSDAGWRGGLTRSSRQLMTMGVFEDVEYATSTWVEWWNNARLYSTLGYVTPIEHEQAHYAAITAPPLEPRPI